MKKNENVTAVQKSRAICGTVMNRDEILNRIDWLFNRYLHREISINCLVSKYAPFINKKSDFHFILC
jgi:hypothetical protein